MKKKFRQLQSGAVSIPLVMGLGIMLFLIATSIASVEIARIYLVQATQDGGQAYMYAEGGVRDALLQLARDNTFGTTTIQYTIPMATNGCATLRACVQVVVTPQGVGSTTRRIIGALGYYRSARRGLEATINFDEMGWGKLQVGETRETLSPIGFSQ